MNAAKTLGALALSLAIAACSKNETPSAADAAAPPAASAKNETPSAASAAASGSAASTKSAEAGKGDKGEASSFSAKYAMTAATMYVPKEKDWSAVKFKNDESKMLGEGTFNLAIDEHGTVSGTSEGGALGAAIIDGRLDGDALSATIRRKDPSDEGLTGTLFAKREGDKLEGDMKLAESNAAVVREAKFTAQKAAK
ncbi:hypothetical protein AKJ09_03450 [Labilithrix luteola]|uniref:Lipoprotein n=1 Tax=Labilithrix luteola TaxID=1391654 RepID=A0A0K1PTU8_9BACT|nr:hypothetical protein [Labilithrix luteola]AKU96786.1 hypothetical protein AKJ09_03450 [Labilithrix luteola]